MNPKYVKPSDPDRVFEIGGIKIVRIARTIYFYTSHMIHPMFTRKFGDVSEASNNFVILRGCLQRIKWQKIKRSKWQRFREWF